MNIDDGTADECERLLRAPLQASSELTHREESHLRHALQWYRGNADQPLTLVEWMTVSRVVGEDLAIQLDTGDQYHYLRFDIERNRVVLIDPHDNAQVPIEETDVSSIFEDAAVSLIPARNIQVKTYTAITAVTHEEHGTKLVLGAYNDAFIQHTEDGATIEYDPKTTFRLPEPMTPDEIDDWLDDDASEQVRELVRTNHERNWDSSPETTTDTLSSEK